ncbi:hypothetical protein OU792_18060 [Algoriphagus sp. NF]|nr:hypothetical protein [Algoriphagus sp. NF]MDE0561907.1 hypothetical protein [Algoriphagus sp. NF]
MNSGQLQSEILMKRRHLIEADKSEYLFSVKVKLIVASWRARNFEDIR